MTKLFASSVINSQEAWRILTDLYCWAFFSFLTVCECVCVDTCSFHDVQYKSGLTKWALPSYS